MLLSTILTVKGDPECRRCLKIKDEFEAARGGTPTTPIESEDDEDQISDKFVFESHLRDFLAKKPGPDRSRHAGILNS